jgi:hypothetical protein
MGTLDRCGRFLLAALLHTSACTEEVSGVSVADAGAFPENANAKLLRWVGAIDETDVRVAVILGAGRARLYFCGGASSYQTATRWLDLTFHDEHLEFRDETWRIHAHLAAGGLVGEVEYPGDSVRMFHAHASEQATVAGLYEGTAACGRLGLIVTQAAESDTPTAQGACVGDDIQPVFQVTANADRNGTITVRTPGTEDGVSQLQAATLEPL